MHAGVASYLQFYTFLIAIIRPAIVIALLSGLWLALRRLTLMPGENGSPPGWRLRCLWCSGLGRSGI